MKLVKQYRTIEQMFRCAYYYFNYLLVALYIETVILKLTYMWFYCFGTGVTNDWVDVGTLQTYYTYLHSIFTIRFMFQLRVFH